MNRGWRNWLRVVVAIAAARLLSAGSVKLRDTSSFKLRSPCQCCKIHNRNFDLRSFVVWSCMAIRSEAVSNILERLAGLVFKQQFDIYHTLKVVMRFITLPGRIVMTDRCWKNYKWEQHDHCACMCTAAQTALCCISDWKHCNCHAHASIQTFEVHDVITNMYGLPTAMP